MIVKLKKIIEYIQTWLLAPIFLPIHYINYHMEVNRGYCLDHFTCYNSWQFDHVRVILAQAQACPSVGLGQYRLYSTSSKTPYLYIYIDLSLYCLLAHQFPF